MKKTSFQNNLPLFVFLLLIGGSLCGLSVIYATTSAGMVALTSKVNIQATAQKIQFENQRAQFERQSAGRVSALKTDIERAKESLAEFRVTAAAQTAQQQMELIAISEEITAANVNLTRVRATVSALEQAMRDSEAEQKKTLATLSADFSTSQVKKSTELTALIAAQQTAQRPTATQTPPPTLISSPSPDKPDDSPSPNDDSKNNDDHQDDNSEDKKDEGD